MEIHSNQTEQQRQRPEETGWLKMLDEDVAWLGEHEDTGPAEERVPTPTGLTQRHMELPIILGPPGRSTQEHRVGKGRLGQGCLPIS